MKRFLLLTFVFGFMATSAMAQSQGNPYFIAYVPTASTTTNSTIATLNTYQSALAANTSRRFCRIVNKSASVMRVYVGSPGSATDAQSEILAAGTATSDGGVFNCNSTGYVITDQISISSPTATSAYLVRSQ